MNNLQDSDIFPQTSSPSVHIQQKASANQKLPASKKLPANQETRSETYFLSVDIGNTAIGCALTTTPLSLKDIPFSTTPAIPNMHFEEIRFSTTHILQQLEDTPSTDKKSIENYLYDKIASFITKTLSSLYGQHTHTSPSPYTSTPATTTPSVSVSSVSVSSVSVSSTSTPATTLPTITLIFTLSSVVPRLSPLIESVFLSLKKNYSFRNNDSSQKNYSPSLEDSFCPYRISGSTANFPIYRAHYQCAQNSGLKISIPHPEIIGEDLLADCVGALPILKNNHTGINDHIGILVIDFGTATKYLLLSPQGEFISAVIAPGIETSISSLSNSAAQLPPLDTSFISTFSLESASTNKNSSNNKTAIFHTSAHSLSHLPTTTQEAMEVGIYNYLYGGIKETIRYFRELTPYPLKIITSGGQGHDISLSLGDSALYDRYLPYRGLIQMALSSMDMLINIS